MIGFIRGEVLESSEGRALVAVGTPDGSSALGYSVALPQSASYLSILPGQPVSLFVYTHVREDALDLFGFRTSAEKELFLTLLSVSGVGPKVAMAALSGAEPDTLVQAIIESDKALLTKIPGVGKKTADRLVVELADKLSKKHGTKFVAPSSAKAPAGASSALVHDARDALVGLGYREQDVSAVLNKMIGEMEAPPARAEELVRGALKHL